MSGKYEKKKNLFPVVILILVAAGLAALLLFRSRSGTVTSQTPQTAAPQTTTAPIGGIAELPYDLGDGLLVTDIASYAGIFMEDGSDEIVSKILMLKLENTSQEDIQLARIHLQYGDAEASFQITNLPAGGKLVALEENRMAYREEMPTQIMADNVVAVEKFALYEDILRISGMDGALNVKNISDADISEDIFVYYKNVADDTYYGGITYRVRIEGGLKTGEIRQMMTEHYDSDGSEIVMVSFGA